MGVLENVYDHSPIVFQNLMCSIKGYTNNRVRYGKEYYDERRFLKEFDKWPLSKKLSYQNEELKKFVAYVEKNSVFYHKLYSPIDISMVDSIEKLKKLPVVDKEMLRGNISEIMIETGDEMEEWHTGGTTGKSLVVRNPVLDGMRRMAMLDHFKSRVGFENRKMKRATFNGKHIVPRSQVAKVFWRYNAACKQMIFSTFHISEANMGYYVAELNRFKPQALDGFFSSMCDIARYIERHSLELEFTPIAIFPTSETLTGVGRELLERVFKCKVYDQYASSEGAPFITECACQIKHIELASGVFEQMDDSDEILVTSFTTHGTPLVRYRIGDRMTFALQSEKCHCGMDSPVVTSIEGRRQDFLYTSDGAKINAGNVANLFKNLSNAIICAQLVQTDKSSVIALLNVDNEQYRPEYDDLLRDEFTHKFGPETELIIRHVESIQRESSGKFRMIINKVGPL